MKKLILGCSIGLGCSILALLGIPAAAVDYTAWPNGAVPVSVTAAPVANTVITLTIPVTAGWLNYVYDVQL